VEKWRWREVSDLLILDPEHTKNSPPPRDSSLCPCVLHYALAALASPLLFARGSGFALTAHATQTQLGLRPGGSRLVLRARGSGFALAAHATRSRLLAACLRLALRASPSRFALCACLSGFALAARAMPLRLAAGLRPRSSCCDEDTGGDSDCGGTNNQQSTKRTETTTMTATTITIETKGMAVAVAAEAR